MKFAYVGILLILSYAQSSATIWFYRPASASGPLRTIYQIGGGLRSSSCPKRCQCSITAHIGTCAFCGRSTGSCTISTT